MSEHTPYVPAAAQMRDLTVRAVVAGALFGAMFGWANAYLGLKVGLTISTSIPLAVMSVGLFKVLERLGASSNILECNISQTMGSASSSLASGLIFTLPAVFMWGFSIGVLQMAVLAILGGIAGILCMIPLRPYLIVREHAVLPYPEGTAAGQVLVASDTGGAKARGVFVGLGVGAAYKALLSFGHLFADKVVVRVPLLRKGVIGLDPTPALLGVGYILGYRTAAIMFAGGFLSWLVLIPAIAHFGAGSPAPLFPSRTLTIAEMTPDQIWSSYVRYIGAGAVAFAGILTVIRALPTMYRSFADGLKGFTAAGRERSAAARRTERDLPMTLVLSGFALVVAVTALSNHVLGEAQNLPVRVIGALCVAAFAFMFVTVSSRIVGLVGVTSNPTSGMTIVTLLCTAGLFAALGWTTDADKVTVLTIGTVVAVAASIAGDISQDLKCGYIIGATPWKQQSVELLGVLTSAFAVAAAVYVLGKGLGFGTEALPAPQATLMKTVIEGVLQANLPWGLVMIGAALALGAQLLGVPALPFAVGIYLPVSTMSPVFLGGCLRALVDAVAKRRRQDAAARHERGVLVASGLIAGEGLLGVGLAVYAYALGRQPGGFGIVWPGAWAEVVAAVAFVGLGAFLYGSTRLPAEAERS